MGADRTEVSLGFLEKTSRQGPIKRGRKALKKSRGLSAKGGRQGEKKGIERKESKAGGICFTPTRESGVVGERGRKVNCVERERNKRYRRGKGSV